MISLIGTAEFRELLLVDLNPDLLFETADHLDRSDADWSTRRSFFSSFSAEYRSRPDSCPCPESRSRMIGSYEGSKRSRHRAFCIARQLDDVKLLPGFQAGAIHLRAPLKLENHFRLAGSRDGTQACESGQHTTASSMGRVISSPLLPAPRRGTRFEL